MPFSSADLAAIGLTLRLAGGMVLFSFVVLLGLNLTRRKTLSMVQ